MWCKRKPETATIFRMHLPVQVFFLHQQFYDPCQRCIIFKGHFSYFLLTALRVLIEGFQYQPLIDCKIKTIRCQLLVRILLVQTNCLVNMIKNNIV